MAKVFLETGDDYRVFNNNTTLFGVADDATDSVIIEAGITGVTVNANVDRVDFAGALADFTFVAGFGANTLVYAADGTTLVASIPLQEDADGTQLVFSDGAITSIWDGTTNTTGGVTTPTTVSAITPDAGDIDTTTTTAATVPEPPPAASLSIDDVTVDEDAGSAVFTVTLSTAPGTGETVTVDYATADGSALAGTDYTSTSGTLTFAAAETTQTITVPIIDNTIVGTTDAFTVNLSNATGTIGTDTATIADASATGTITENDVAIPGETFTMVTGADIIVGTDGDDTINGLVVMNPISGDNDVTFSNIDIVDGGAGDDVLNVQVDATANGASVANVETINLTAFGNHTFSMGSVTGCESFVNKNSIANVTLDAVSEIYNLTVQSVNNKITTVNYDDAAVTGLTDVQTLVLNSATNNADITFDSATAGTLETLSITSTGAANKVQLQNATANNDLLAGTATVLISGDQDLDLTSATMAGLTTVTSTSTGDVTLDITASAAKDTVVTTGVGDDKVTTTTITKDDSFDLGAGSDTVVLTAATTVTTAPTLTGVETLRVAVAADASLNLDNATSFTTLSVGTGADVITVTKVAPTGQTITFDTGDGTLGAVDYDSVIFTLEDSTGTSDELTINVQNTNAEGAHVRSTKDTQKTITAVTANNIETINITSADMGVDDSTAANDSGLVITTLTSSKLQTLNITSDTLVTISNTIDSDVNDINATGATGGVVLDLANGADNSETTHASTTLDIDTGAGADTLANINADVAATKINTGDGKDSITLAAGDFGDGAATVVDTITINAGAGDDTVDVSASTTLYTTVAATQEGTMSITLGDGVDTIKLAGTAASGTLIQSGITIEDFVAGAGGDKIDFNDNSAITASATTYLETANGTDIAAAAGMTIYTANDLTELSALALETAANTAAAGGVGQSIAHTAGDDYYVIASDGTDAGIFLVTDGIDASGDGAGDQNADAVIDAAEVALIGILAGLSDASTLSVDNFTDFLA